VAQLIAYCILGHHTGLPNRLGDRSYDERIEEFNADKLRAPDKLWRSELEVDATQLYPPCFSLASDRKERSFQFGSWRA
jgi:CRISPR-associated endonuclease/helicase Cas3